MLFGNGYVILSKCHAGVAELADAPDLGSGISDVQVRFLSPALIESVDFTDFTVR